MSGAKTPLLDAVLQGDLDAAGFKILNLNLSSLASGAPFFDDTALIRGSVDGTKLAHFDLSLIGSAQHRVFQLPNYNGRLATVAGTEALTNKSINGITFAGVGGFDLDQAIISIAGEFATDGNIFFINNTDDLTIRTTDVTDVTLPVTGTLATTAQLPVISNVPYNAGTWNGNLDGASKDSLRDKFESLTTELPPFSDQKEILKNVSDATKQVKFALGGLTTATTRTLTVPDKNGTLAMLDDVPDFAGILFDADEPSRQLYLAGNVGFFGPFTLAGGFLTVLTATGATALTLPTTGTLATLAGAETLSSKAFVGGTVNSIEELSIRSTGSAFDRSIEIPDVMTSNRKLTLTLGNVDRIVTLSGNLSTAGALTFAGAYAATLNFTGATNISMPTTGTVCARVAVPAANSSSGVAGQFASDSGFAYFCYDIDSWGRVALDITFP